MPCKLRTTIGSGRIGLTNANRTNGPTLTSVALIGVVFFFQAEDGIRDLTVTGVQTCALPISRGQVEVLQKRDPFLVGEHGAVVLEGPAPPVRHRGVRGGAVRRECGPLRQED